ncbi:MAG TPA: type I-E CRISPR-associated protein Cse1/CasA [Acidobacteriota bacterium]|nr:type I-E CRISPR-associated protein Cse1/CasA [Acidobacteriota bacterium]
MNLTTDAWIPALQADGTRHLFSLQALFAEAHLLRDLAVKPHERIALMRLLLCITQAALDGPVDQDEWEECRDDIQPRVRAYLDRWRASFELYGDGPRFLQLANLSAAKKDDEGTPATKLDLSLATGNTSTVFDNAASETRSLQTARAALNLLTFQCFSPCGLIGVANWDGRQTARTCKHAPCAPSSMVHSFLLGGSLLETIARNLLTKQIVADTIADGWGKPVWEMPVNKPTDTAAIRNATVSYLGRLLPLSRAIRLHENGTAIILGTGLEYPILPAFREATATIVLRDDEPGVLPASIGRSIWRQLHAITVKRRAKSDAVSGPLAFGLNSIDHTVSIWTGAFITATNAKILDVVEATYSVPPELFDPFGQAAYEAGVAHAETTATNLGKAIGSYSAALKIDTPAYEKGRQDFWTTVEQSLDALFTAAREKTAPEAFGATPWGRAIRDAALAAYERTCPRRTPRQLQAYATGLRLLHAAPTANQSTKKTRRKNS